LVLLASIEILAHIEGRLVREPNALEVPAAVSNRVGTPVRPNVATTNDHEAIEAMS
jgi:hypothetical protein